MDVKKFAGFLMAIGGVIILAAIIWWDSFYGKIAKEINAQLGDAFHCLYSSGGFCGLWSGMANFTGYTPYNPAVFWIGIIIFGIGIVLFLSAKEEK